MRTLPLVLCLLITATGPAWATEFRSGETVSVEPGEVIDDDLFVAGSNVTVAGTVTGDLLAAGQAVRITGPVGGSVMAAGQDVRVTGDVRGSVRAAGQTVTLAGEVGRNAAAAGQTLLLAETARIRRDLHAAANLLDLEGAVGRNAALVASTGTVRGQVADRLGFEGDKLTLGPSARVGGDLVYRTPREADIAERAVVVGAIQKLAPRAPGPKREPRRGRLLPRRALPWLAVVSFPTVFVFGLVGLALSPRFFLASANAVGRRAWWNVFLGALILLLGPAAVFLIMVTVIGLPLGLLGFVAWLTALIFSEVPVATSLGRFVVSRFTGAPASPYLGLFIGMLGLAVLAWIPLLGPVIIGLTALLGLGAYARAAKGVLVEMRHHPA